MVAEQANTKTTSENAGTGAEQSSVVFNTATSLTVDPWHYGKEVTRLQDIVAQALAIAKGNGTAQNVYQSAIELHQQKLKKFSDEMEPRKAYLADAQKSTSSFAATIISARKAHLTDGLFANLAALNDLVALQDSRIQALMKKNEELEAVLASKK